MGEWWIVNGQWWMVSRELWVAHEIRATHSWSAHAVLKKGFTLLLVSSHWPLTFTTHNKGTMKKILLILFVLTQKEIFSQPVSQNQQDVINAENNFAGLSKSANTIDAFCCISIVLSFIFKNKNHNNTPIRYYY